MKILSIDDYKNIKKETLMGNPLVFHDFNIVCDMNAKLCTYLDKHNISDKEFEILKLILEILNIVYANTSESKLPVEDEIYDSAIELYKSIEPNIPIGAPKVIFGEIHSILNAQKTDTIKEKLFEIVDESDYLFADDISKGVHDSLFERKKHSVFSNEKEVNESLPTQTEIISKRLHEMKHQYPELAGTLDKCKFVLNKHARERGIFNDSNVQVFERDFLGKHVAEGITNPDYIEGIVMLKYDGVGISSSVSTMMRDAYNRGDTGNDITTNMTPIFYGYPFPKTFKMNIPDNDTIGVQFEAIMTYNNFNKYNRIRTDREDYKNPRTAIIGLLSSSDVLKYIDLITLVPLKALYKIENLTKQVEIEMMNKMYANSSQSVMRYALVKGRYEEVLYQVNKFVDEAMSYRDYMPYMYDGVVFTYNDPKIMKKLGRVNNVDKFSMAIKFPSLKKQTVFTGYSYTVGQHGKITPMINYLPVEFLGTIHPQSSGQSYGHFMNLGLRLGDILNIEYVNDVMPYVYKADCDKNLNNPNPVIEFIKECPICHTPLEVTKSGKTAICPNISCSGRTHARGKNIAKKLNIQYLGGATIDEIQKYTLHEILSIRNVNDLAYANLGDGIKQRIVDEVNNVHNNPIDDFTIVGAIGFTSVSKGSWKIILKHIHLKDIMTMVLKDLYSRLVSIKGVGRHTANTIVEELPLFIDDMQFIINMPNVKYSYGAEKKKTIRFTGVRDAELVKKLNTLGFDADGNSSITKSTDIIVIPYIGYENSKTKKYADKLFVDIETIRRDPEFFM